MQRVRRGSLSLLQFQVEDSGVGIAQADIGKLFSLFGMLENNRRQMNQSGTGIGLSISKRLVESLGGEIEVESREGSWTRFTFTILDHAQIHQDSNFRLVRFVNQVNDVESSLNCNINISGSYDRNSLPVNAINNCDF